MKKGFVSLLILLFAAGCGGSGFTFNIANEPTFKTGEATEIVLQSESDEGETLTGLAITAELQMENMDHGTIEMEFTDNGDGTYVGEAELPMAGEWIMATKTELEGEEYDHLIRLTVKEE